MNIKDFSFSASFNDSQKASAVGRKIVGNAPQKAVRKDAIPAESPQKTAVTAFAGVKRERISISPTDTVKDMDGQVFNRNAPKGTYIDLVI